MVVSIIRKQSFASRVTGVDIDCSISHESAKEMLISELEQARVKVTLANEIERKIKSFLEDSIEGLGEDSVDGLGDININIIISSIGVRIRKESSGGYDINNPRY